MFKELAVSAVVAAVVLAASSARANFIGFLTSYSTDTYNYTLRFTPDTTSPPTLGQEQLIPGDLVTFYDVVPSASNLLSLPVVNGVDAADFTVTAQPTGLTPPNLGGATGIPDGAAINVTFEYTGPALLAAKDFTATIKTATGFVGVHVGTGAGDSLVDYGGGVTLENDVIYHPLLPVVPEPATLAVFAFGSLGLFARRRRG